MTTEGKRTKRKFLQGEKLRELIMARTKKIEDGKTKPNRYNLYCLTVISRTLIGYVDQTKETTYPNEACQHSYQLWSNQIEGEILQSSLWQQNIDDPRRLHHRHRWRCPIQKKNRDNSKQYFSLVSK